MTATASISVNLNEQAKEILKKAQEKGVEHSYMFIYPLSILALDQTGNLIQED